MKSHFSIVLLSMVLATSAAALPASLGIQGGVMFSNASNTSQISTTTRTGFVLGLNIELGFGETFFLQPELSFAQRGFDLIDVAGNRFTARYDSLEAPLFLKIKFGDVVRPYVFAGPKAILNISRHLVTSVSGSTAMISFNASDTEWAVDFGGGIDLGSLFANIRYSMGLVDLNENYGDWRSRGFQLIAGIKFG